MSHKTMPAFMLDTNAFNRALDKGIDPKTLSGRGHLCITHVQVNELQATKNSDRLTSLLSVFEAIEQESVPTAAAVWDVSEFGAAEWGGADGLYDKVLTSLSKRNNNKDNNVRDVLIGVTAIKRGLTLVTNDRDLATVVREHGGNSISFEELLA
ncbi:type II toxin-antitoxin system VapC family toxin [Steroidobacter flavus]|uniref:Type II toxin-antitoxin system VapC family toxin n=1 Tax=Steroidobacter flavus TaxID=1842136 RepID=A0ABV8SW14_9GAMM